MEQQDLFREQSEYQRQISLKSDGELLDKFYTLLYKIKDDECKLSTELKNKNRQVFIIIDQLIGIFDAQNRGEVTGWDLERICLSETFEEKEFQASNLSLIF